MPGTWLAVACIVLTQCAVSVVGWASRPPHPRPAVTYVNCDTDFGKLARLLCPESQAEKRVLTTRAVDPGVPLWLQNLRSLESALPPKAQPPRTRQGSLEEDTRQVDLLMAEDYEEDVPQPAKFGLREWPQKKQQQQAVATFPTLSYFYDMFPQSGRQGSLLSFWSRQARQSRPRQSDLRVRRSSDDRPRQASHSTTD